MLPSDSYMRRWIDIHRDNYPDDGWVAEMYSGQLLAADLARRTFTQWSLKRRFPKIMRRFHNH